MNVAIIINPISGSGGRPEVARQRAELAASVMSARKVPAEIFVTERPGHARDLTVAALTRGITTVVAWGGDGTVNEIASVLVHRQAAMAVVPSGSGNGLARELGIPFDPGAALVVATAGGSRRIDCGELNGRLFVNVAGLGLDAMVAHEFAAHGLVRRGFARYVEIAARELCRFQPDVHTIDADGAVFTCRALIVAIANARQYGNGALIAPRARVDDGRLDLVAIAYRPLWQTVMQVPRLFTGQIDRVPGVSIVTAEQVSITSGREARCHVDGEPFIGGTLVRARVHPSALQVRVPAPGSS